MSDECVQRLPLCVAATLMNTTPDVGGPRSMNSKKVKGTLLNLNLGIS